MDVYNVIVAGGIGSRLWPLSRESYPKQFLKLNSNDTLLSETIKRLNKLSSKDNLFIVTNDSQLSLLKDTVKNIGDNTHILSEPSVKNTAIAIGYSAIKIMKRYGDNIMCVYPSDHYINDTKEFTDTINKAIDIAMKNEKLVTIGVKPTFISTAYGYILFDKNIEYDNKAYDVIDFIEKPCYQDAKMYVESERYLFNSGIFVWRVSKILEEYKRYLPKIYNKLMILYEFVDTDKEKDKLKEIYDTIPSISIDYSILEVSEDVVVIPGYFKWSDIGSLDMIGNIYVKDDDGNIKSGDCISIDTNNCITYSTNGLIATLGISNSIVVSTGDICMVCSMDKAQRIKEIVEKLKKDDIKKYL